jgi:hypothetical protein
VALRFYNLFLFNISELVITEIRTIYVKLPSEYSQFIILKYRPKDDAASFFYGATNIDYSTAVRAETGIQNYSVCPREWSIDAVLS